MESIAERARAAAKEAALVVELAELLGKLRFHHESQAKPRPTQCSTEYHREMADIVERRDHLRRLRGEE